MRVKVGKTTYLARDRAELRQLLDLEHDEFWKSISRGQLRELSEIAGEAESSPAALNSLESRWLQHNDPEEYDRRVGLVSEMSRMIDGNSEVLGRAIARAYPPPHLLYLSPPLSVAPKPCYGSEEVVDSLAPDDGHQDAPGE